MCSVSKRLISLFKIGRGHVSSFGARVFIIWQVGGDLKCSFIDSPVSLPNLIGFERANLGILKLTAEQISNNSKKNQASSNSLKGWSYIYKKKKE